MNRADTSLQLLQLRDHTGTSTGCAYVCMCVCVPSVSVCVWIAVLLATMYHRSGGFCEAVIDRNSLHAAPKQDIDLICNFIKSRGKAFVCEESDLKWQRGICTGEIAKGLL